MMGEHTKALNSILSVGGLRAELAAIVRYAGRCAEQDEQARRAVYEKYHIEGMKAVERAGSRGVSGARRFLPTCCTR